MEKVKIKNRKGQNIAVLLEETQDSKGLAFVMHGLGGFKEQLHIATFAQAFKDKGFTVVRFDTTDTYGESDGNYEDATTTNYYEDLEDVIEWAKSQPWYRKPFCLAGHSLGGISTALYAEKHPEKIKALAPISTVVSGKLSSKTFSKEELENWKKTGWREQKSESIPGLIKRLKWAHMEDRMKYDLLPEAGKLTMPVLLIVGEEDEYLYESQALLEAIPGNKKELHVIEGAPHTFREPEHIKEVKDIFLKWIDQLDNKS
ncbi:MAG: alpha/beta fold hydrolase [bacterium]|nr:alpha/beta fold hydrolase [bacterium]